MTIFTHASSESEVERIRTCLPITSCLYCGSQLTIFGDKGKYFDRPFTINTRSFLSGNMDSSEVALCRICGWWKKTEAYSHCYHGTPLAGGGWCFLNHYSKMVLGTVGKLRDFDITDISVPLEDVRSYLAAFPESRFNIHPRIFEEVVASVFRDHGFQVELTAYTADGGIDAILRSNNSNAIAVQVKRSKNAIEVEQIRAFMGAMFLAGVHQGIYVTTSKFRRGCLPTSAESRVRGLPVELIDAPRFFDALGIAQRKCNFKIPPIASLPILQLEGRSLPHI